MSFSVQKWRKSYDAVHALGRELRDSKPTHFKGTKQKSAPPKTILSEDEQLVLEERITRLLKASAHYLDKNGMRRSKPLWKYDEKKEETHYSSPKFIYGHLLPV